MISVNSSVRFCLICQEQVGGRTGMLMSNPSGNTMINHDDGHAPVLCETQDACFRAAGMICIRTYHTCKYYIT